MRVLVSVAAVVVVAAACGAPAPPASSPGARTPSAPRPTDAPPSAPTASPPGELVLGQTFDLFYDPVLERVVLVNGAIEGGPSRPIELWAWRGEGWELVDASGPEARGFAAVARDPDRGVLVVHGGASSTGVAFDQTLEWDGRDWTEHPAPAKGPGPRDGAGIAYDANGGRMVLFGGAVGSEQQPDTWAWDGTAWTALAETGPRPRFISLMTEERELGGILLHGGHWVDGSEDEFLDDTWLWDVESWNELPTDGAPGPRVNAPGAWDERLGGIVMFGGGTGAGEPMSDETWLWRDGWTLVETEGGPSPRNGHRLAFDASRQVLVLVGGLDRPGGDQRLDVWELDADGWREALPAN